MRGEWAIEAHSEYDDTINTEGGILLQWEVCLRAADALSAVSTRSISLRKSSSSSSSRSALFRSAKSRFCVIISVLFLTTKIERYHLACLWLSAFLAGCICCFDDDDHDATSLLLRIDDLHNYV